MVLSEALVLHSCPRAPSTCSHSGLTLGAPQGPPVRRRSVAIHSGHGSSGSPVLSPSRWGGGGEAGEAGSHRVTFRKKTIRHSSARCRRAFPQMFLAGAHSSPSAGFRSGAHVPNQVQSPRTGPSARLTTLRPSSLLSGRPEALVSITPSFRPSPVHSWGGVSRSAMSPSPARLREPRSCS